LNSIFSVEMRSKRYVKSISISDEAHDRVLFEGILGELKEVSFIEDTILEVVGANGVLRIGIGEGMLRKALAGPSHVSRLSSEVESYTSTTRKGE